MVQTSLIPTVITLSQFFANNFPDISWYPNWYLGNPYQFLTGPIVPALLAILNFSCGAGSCFARQFSMTQIYLGFIFLSLLAGGIGIYFFLRDWQVGKREAVLSSVLFFIIPGSIFLLQFQNGLNHVAFGIFPYILLLFKRFIQKKDDKLLSLILSFLIAFAFLINPSIFLAIVFGIIALFVPLHVKDELEDKIIKTILILLLAISLSSIWYTPRFWWVIFSNPSFGGVPLFNLVGSLIKSVLNLLPLVFAVLVVKWRRYKPENHVLFALLFFSSFLFLTLLRLFSDIDFVTDWIGFGLELQFGAAILMGSMLSKFKVTIQNLKLLIIFIGLVLLIIINIAIIVRLFDCSIVNYLKTKQCNNGAMEQSGYQSRIVNMLKDNIKDGERVFLSGSSVFWINSQINVSQVRGGVDQGSINPFWAHGAYQIREGENSKLTKALLSVFGVSYILVHEKGSEEYYQDYKHQEKFKSFPLLKEERGDVLYKVNNSSIGRIAKREILSVKKPENGADKKAIYSYANDLTGSANVIFTKANVIDVTAQTKNNQVISLAMTYDKRWKIMLGGGSSISDSIGNMIIIPEKEGLHNFKLQYQLLWYDWGVPVLASFIFILSILNYSKLFPIVKKRLPKIHIGMQEDEY